MSFVTVFTAGTMGFVLLAPLLMVAILVLSQAQLSRRSGPHRRGRDRGARPGPLRQPRRLSTTTSSTSDTAWQAPSTTTRSSVPPP